MPDWSELAKAATYVGSGEHKRYPNPLADPALRTDASDCDSVDAALSQDPERLRRVLRAAIQRGQVDERMEGSFPRYAWGRLRTSDGVLRIFEARLTNALQGAYKGYFIDESDLVGKKARIRPKVAEGGVWSEELA